MLIQLEKFNGKLVFYISDRVIILNSIVKKVKFTWSKPSMVSLGLFSKRIMGGKDK